MLDPAPASVERIEEVRNIADRVDARRAGLETLVDDDAVLKREAAAGEELNVRNDPDADHCEVSLDAVTALGLDVREPAVATESRNLLFEQHLDAALAVERRQLVTQIT